MEDYTIYGVAFETFDASGRSLSRVTLRCVNKAQAANLAKTHHSWGDMRAAIVRQDHDAFGKPVWMLAEKD